MNKDLIKFLRGVYIKFNKYVANNKNNKLYLIVCSVCLVAILAVYGVRLHSIDRQMYNPSSIPFYSLYIGSDQVAQQTILHDWQEGYGERATTGDDNWIIKWPLYQLTNNLPLEPIDRYFLTSLIILLTTAAGLFGVSILFINTLFKNIKQRLYAVIILAAFLIGLPEFAFEYIRWPNSRNIELVIYFGLLFSLYQVENGKKWLKKHTAYKVAGLVAVAAILFLDDPLFMYISIPLLVGIVSLRYILGIDNLTKRTIVIASSLVASLAGMYVLRFIMSTFTPLKLYAHNPATFDSSQIVMSIKTFVGDLLEIAGLSLKFTDLSTLDLLHAALCAVLLVCAIIGIVVSIVKKPKSLFYQYLLLAALWDCALIIVMGAGVSNDGAGSRYSIALIVIEILGLIMFIKHVKLQRQKVGLFAAAILFVLVSCVIAFNNARKPIDQYTKVVHQDNRQKVIDTIEENGLTKGYANFDGNVMTYLTNYKVHYLPSMCLEKPDKKWELRYFDILNDIGVKNKFKADKTFYVRLDDENNCAGDNLESQFGTPEKVLYPKLPNGAKAEIFIYNYDISSKIPIQKID